MRRKGTEHSWALPPRQSDGLVGEQAQLFIDFPVRQPFIAGVALLAGDKKDFLGGELGIPGVVGVAQVFYDNGAFGQAEAAGLLDFVLPGWGDGHKGRQIAAVIQQGV
jgi:hypothetical protein